MNINLKGSNEDLPLEPLISVIVPIYQVEKYLRKCVDSLISQSYSNYEILLIDDGSSDGCGRICDEYAFRYPQRIRTFHKPNGGLASARNFGLQCAKGEFYSFVDSDDFVDDDYLSYLYSLTENGSIRLVAAGFHQENEMGELLAVESSRKKFNLSCAEGLRRLCYNDGLSPSAWSKLYHCSLFETTRYPDGMIYEDLAVIYRLIDASKRFVIGPKPIYHYVLRQHSIITQAFSTKNLDLVKVSEEMIRFFSANYPRLEDSAIRRYVVSNFQLINAASLPKDLEVMRTLRKNILKYQNTILFRSGTLRDKAAIVLLQLGIRPYKFVWSQVFMKKENYKNN